MAAYRPRLIDPLVAELLSEVPAILLVGPRATGKTTTARRHASSTVQLDRPAEAAAFHADPDSALRGLNEPILLDEWQAVPQVLGAVKRAVDADPRPNRFILTGSVRADIDQETWPGTGRVIRVPVLPLTIGELRSSLQDPLLDRLVNGAPPAAPSDTPDLSEYLHLALGGGFPEPALSLGRTTRQRWLESYVDHVVTRDALTIEPGRDPSRLRRYFEAYGLNSAGMADDTTLFEGAGINRRTANAYRSLLNDLMVIDELPAWTTNRLKRLAKAPKRFLIDASLLTGLTRVDHSAVMRDGNLLGRTLETFAVAQLRAEQAIAQCRPRLHHLRQEQGRHEIDVIAELGGGRIIGIEVKATAAPSADDARHLMWLRDQMPERFVAGLVLHTGVGTFKIAEQIYAAPISTLWS